MGNVGREECYFILYGVGKKSTSEKPMLEGHLNEVKSELCCRLKEGIQDGGNSRCRGPLVGILFLACLANSKDAIMFVCGVEGRGLRQELVMLQVRSEKK